MTVDAIEEPVEDPQPGGWGGWEELPPAEPAQQDAPEDAPKDLEEGEVDEDAEAEFAVEGASHRHYLFGLSFWEVKTRSLVLADAQHSKDTAMLPCHAPVLAASAEIVGLCLASSRVL